MADHNVKTEDKEEKDWARMNNLKVKVKRKRDAEKETDTNIVWAQKLNRGDLDMKGNTEWDDD